jgi:hypothetical protein
MPPKKSITFNLPDDDEKPESEVFRKSKYVRGSTSIDKDEKVDVSDKNDDAVNVKRASSQVRQNSVTSSAPTTPITTPRKSKRLTQMFQKSNFRRSLQSISYRPRMKYEPTFRLEPKKLFDPFFIKDMLKSFIDDEMISLRSVEFNDKTSMVNKAREMSESLMQKIKSQEYYGYRIFVSIIVGEKKHQAYHENYIALWDSNLDRMISYANECEKFFVTAKVIAVYYD